MAEKIFPTLYAKSSTGKVKLWTIAVRHGPLGPRAEWGHILTWHGYVDQDVDKIQLATRWIENGKNIGKKNETTAFEQACLEAESMWNKKKDKKYVEDTSGESDALLPMLAHNYKKRGHNIEWPAIVQPKLNGVRCLATKVSEAEIRYTSRGGKEFTTLAHLTEPILRGLKNGETLDGELFTLDLPFEDIVSAVKREQENTKKLQFWAYDIIVEGKPPFSVRRILYHTAVKDAKSDLLVPVQTKEALDEKEMIQLHGHHVQEGLEGTIIRNRKGAYRCDFKSADLQKYKDFLDDEFVIIGGKDGIGKYVESITWICITAHGEEFDVVPKGTMPQRREWYKDREQYFGKKITVRYQNLSDDRKVPVFPVGLAIRDYE